MNVFYTNECPVIAANEHCYTHQVKMIVEYTQILSAAHHVCGGTDAKIYKLTHKNHPSAVWIRQSLSHYNWVLTCAIELCHLYHQRTGKRHATEDILVELCHEPNIDDIGFCEPPAVIDDDLKPLAFIKGVAHAYQVYLVRKFSEWATRTNKRQIHVKFDSVPQWAR